MKILSLVPVGEVAHSELESLGAGLAPKLRVACSIQSNHLDVAGAFDALRGQYNSTRILRQLQELATSESWRVLGISDADLFIPILSFVFGEAQLGPLPVAAAVVSMHRLRQEFYGLPSNPELQAERLLKEALHELGHTLGLRHCPDYRCVMSSSHAVENIDLKTAEFCATCAAAI
ncbi:MAG: archaemetzincin family Zn-dependent metalloprotease [Acidobacteria bacterium]|nr:archaemetzincin family Zn-dependent metalloprotease [Acidobacteriota bacterium]